jgi:hypothetical protein
MSSSIIAALDGMFADEPEEIVERVLRAYQPILNRTIMVHLRMDLQRNLDGHIQFAPWRTEGQPAVQSLGSLTATQVAFLGGTRPTRMLEDIAAELKVPVESGDRESEQKLYQISLSSRQTDKVIDHYVVAKVKGREARARRVREFVEFAVAAQFASLIGALSGRHDALLLNPEEEEEEPEFIRRHFLGAIRMFRKLKLTPTAQAVFQDHFLDDREIEDIAEDEGRELEEEIERRRVFLKGLARALREALDRPKDDARAPEALPGAKPRPRALTQATARAARPRRR